MTDNDSTGEGPGVSLPPVLFVFAATGVCLGLNDIWRFPFLFLEHGTLWFPLVYLLGVLLIGVPLMIAELALARLGHSHPSVHFGFVLESPDTSRLWQYAGIIVLIAVFLILSYTTVVASWMTSYAARAVTGGLDDISLGASRLMFQSLITDPERLLGWLTLFVLALAWVARRGAVQGTGRIARILVIAVFVVAALLAAASVLDFGEGAERTLSWSLDPSGLSVGLVVDAVTQSFFTLGVCMGAMMILGVYLPADARIGPLVASVVGLDFLFVVLSCTAVLPTLQSGETGGLGGVTYAMETVPLLLSAVPFGRLYLAAFYLLLLLLLTTTAVVLMEVLVAWVGHVVRKSRSVVVSLTATAVWGGGLLSLLSFGALSFDFEFVGEVRNFGLFDVMDILSAQILLPIIGLLMTVFIGWNVARQDFGNAMGWIHTASVLHHLKRYWLPAAMAVIFFILVFGRVF